MTNALKGLAIITVLVAHYASRYDYDFYSRWMTDYATEAIAIFFVLSGFGIFYSLERRFSSGESTGRILLGFAYARFVRIYPLYWLSMATIPLFYMPLPEYYDQMYHSGLYSVLIWLGFPLIRNNELWFITAILQCYWLAPLLYYGLKRLGLARFAILTAVLLAGATFISAIFYFQEYSLLHLPYIEAPLVLFYKNFLLGNVFLFALGMMMAPLAAAGARFFRGYLPLALTTVAFVALLYLTRGASPAWQNSGFFLTPFFYISIMLFCLAVVINEPPVPLGFLIRSFGRHSYTVYLFNYQLLALIGTLGLVSEVRPMNVSAASNVLALFLLPLALVICIGIEKAAYWPVRRIERFVSARRPSGRAALDAD